MSNDQQTHAAVINAGPIPGLTPDAGLPKATPEEIGRNLGAMNEILSRFAQEIGVVIEQKLGALSGVPGSAPSAVAAAQAVAANNPMLIPVPVKGAQGQSLQTTMPQLIYNLTVTNYAMIERYNLLVQGIVQLNESINALHDLTLAYANAQGLPVEDELRKGQREANAQEVDLPEETGGAVLRKAKRSRRR